MKIFPDYNKSILNVPNSILKHFGALTHHATLPSLDKKLSKNPKNVILILLDGMGTNVIRKHLSFWSFLRRHKIDDITSIFPSTTVAAKTTIFSGKSPLEHGRIGWRCWLPDGRHLELYTNKNAERGEAFEEKDLADKLLPFESLAEQIKDLVETHDVQYHKACPDGPKNTIELIDKIIDICKSKNRVFIQSYLTNPDVLCHLHGPYSKVIRDYVRQANKDVKRLKKKIPDSVIIVMADHGEAEIKKELFLNDHPDIMDCFVRSPSFEERYRSFKIKKGRKERFEILFQKYFGKEFELLSKDYILNNKLFGPGKEHEFIDSAIGDYIAISRGNAVLRFLSAGTRAKEKSFRGHHGSLTKEEMEVSLIVI